MNRLLMPLAGLYGAGARLRQLAFREGWLQSQQLCRTVVSIGNLTVGGSGKTPLVSLVVRILLRHGYKPAILTRGYGRERGADLIALEPQANRAPDSRTVGDEPALLARALPEVPILICANRYRAGELAEKRFGIDVHILDDGFQHLALKRDVDLVTVDVTQELSNGALLPAGRLREPVSALLRADMIVLTRTEIKDPTSMEEHVRQINPQAAVFRCGTGLRCLLELGHAQPIAPGIYHGKPVCAFCAIGNPSAFFSNLRRWGFNPVSHVTFHDHHVYCAEDIKRLNEVARGNGATALLTTEKDFMNLPPKPEFRCPVMACEIEAEITEGEKFEQLLLAEVEKKQLRPRVESAV